MMQTTVCKFVDNEVCRKKSQWKWWPISESNQGHTDFQSVALPTELIGHNFKEQNCSFFLLKVSLV